MSERPGPSLDRVRSLFDETAGDEKHDPSAQSVLVPLWALYDRVLRHDPAAPDWAERDRFLLSKGHGPLAPKSVRLGGVGVPRQVTTGYGSAADFDDEFGITPAGIAARLRAFLGVD